MRRGLLPRRFALELVRIGRRHPKVVLLLAAGAWLAAGLTAAGLRVETDILSLVPRDNPVVKDFKTTIERFGSVDTLLVVVHLRSGEDLEADLAFADTLALTLREWKLLDWLEYRIESGAAAAVPLLDRVTLFMEPEALDKLLLRLDGDALDEEMRRIHSQLLTPQSLVTKEFIRHDPLGLLPRIIERVRFGGLGVSVDPDTGCLLDPDRRFLLMLAKPVRPAQDLRFDRELSAGLDERVQRAGEHWKADGWQGPVPSVDFTGGYVITLSDSRLITSDAVVGMTTALVGVMLLFLLAFRRPAALLLALLPLVTGLGLALVFVAVALGRLNSLTSASGALLIGLGIDFVIVLYGRYVEERQAGRDHDQAVDAMGRHTGVGVMLGAVTTAATFYAFLVTDFRGLSELGLLTGTGILLLVVAVLLLLPALLTVFYGKGRRPRQLSLRSFGSDRLCRSCLRHPRWTLAIAGLATVALGAATLRLSFDDDIRNMRSPHNRGIIVRQQVMEAFGLRFSPMTVRVDGVDERSVMAAARRLLPELESLVDGENLASIDTIAGVVPPVETQLEIVDRLVSWSPSLDGFEERLDAALRRAGLNPAAFSPGVAHLVNALELRAPLALDDLDGTTLERVVDRYLVRHDEGVSTAIYCYPPAEKWRRGAPPALQAVVDRFPEAVLAAPTVVSAELRRIVWGDAARAATFGMVLVFALLWADFSSPLRALFALLPLAVGMVWMLGAMALVGMKVNFMNIFVLTMIIGIGVDYGIHLLHRWQESGGSEGALSETAKAIAVAALTTVVGFGSMVLSHFPGLRSVGAAAILGALSTAILSITVLPVLLEGIGPKSRERPAGG